MSAGVNYFPVFLNVRGKPCVVVGGGSIGSRKASALVEAGAVVTVVSPTTGKSLLDHVSEGTVRHVRRHYQTGDLKGCLLAYAATGLAEVDEAMMAEARNEGVLINVVDRSSMCDFIAPAVVRRGDITLAISTNGKSPGLAKLIRRKLERVVTPAYAEVLSLVADKRSELKQSVSSAHERKRLLREFTESMLTLRSSRR